MAPIRSCLGCQTYSTRVVCPRCARQYLFAAIGLGLIFMLAALAPGCGSITLASPDAGDLASTGVAETSQADASTHPDVDEGSADLRTVPTVDALSPPDPCIPRCATYCSGKDTSDTTCICYCH